MMGDVSSLVLMSDPRVTSIPVSDNAEPLVDVSSLAVPLEDLTWGEDSSGLVAIAERWEDRRA